MTTAFLDEQCAASQDSISTIELHLQGRLRGRVRDLRLKYSDAGLVLEGRASTYYAKQLAQQALLESTTLPLCSNEICVL